MTYCGRRNGGAKPTPSWLDANLDQQTADPDPPPGPALPEVYALREVAQIFDRTARTLRTWVRAGHRQRGGFGNAVFFSRGGLLANPAVLKLQQAPAPEALSDQGKALQTLIANPAMSHQQGSGAAHGSP